MRCDFEEEISADLAIIIENEVKRLPPNERVVVALRAAGFTQEECGKLIGLTRPAVGAIHSRAMDALKERLKVLADA